MKYNKALKLIAASKCVARQGWNGKGMAIFLVPGSTFTVNRPPLLGIFPEGTEITYDPHIDMFNAKGTVSPWVASQDDTLASDWKEVEFSFDNGSVVDINR